MSHLELQALNEQFAITDQLTFEAGPGGLPIAVITNEHASATVSLYGGHVTSYQPKGHDEVLWVSSQSRYELGKAIRGGVPICWPWFADHPTEAKKPAHGIVRTARCEVRDTSVVHGNQTRVRLALSDNDQTRAIWPHAFDLILTVTVGPQLVIELAGINRSSEEVICGGALHSYFTVSEASQIAIQGLDGCSYIDKVDSFKRKVQQGLVKITGWTDLIYVDTTGDCVIEDPGNRRCIRIAKSDSRSTVVWNPWSDKAVEMADFGDDEFHMMVCVETANAGDDVVAVAPGKEHRMGTTISVQNIS